MRRLLAVAWVFLALPGLSALPVRAGDPVPATDQIKTMVDGGQYSDALKAIAQAIPATAAGARYDLYMLRGEALLREKQGYLAATAFDMAEGETAQPVPYAVAWATSYLIKQSANLVYAPQSDGGAGSARYDIVDPGQRKEALTALFEKEYAVADAGYKDVKNERSLPPIIDFAHGLGTAHLLELAATGEDAKTRAMVKELATHAETLITNACTDMSRQVDTIDTRANEYVAFTNNVPDPNNARRTIQQTQYQKRGLSANDRATLANVVATCNRIPPAARDLVYYLSTDAGAFRPAVDSAANILRKAQDTLNANYSGVWTNIPAGGRQG